MNGEILSTGSFAIDTRTNRIGQVMGREGPYVQLRPPTGGRDWDVPLTALRAARTAEELSARVSELNKQSRLP